MFIKNQVKTKKAEDIPELTEEEIATKHIEQAFYLSIREALKKYADLFDNTKHIREAFEKAIKKIDKELNDSFTLTEE